MSTTPTPQTAQEQGLALACGVLRQVVPPQLDFLLLVYRPNGELGLSSVMHPSITGQSIAEQYQRSLQAAKTYIDTPPRDDFKARANQSN